MVSINNVNNTLIGQTGTGTFVGSAGATLSSPTFTTPALGTPASGNLVNCTGYPATALSGITPVANGGTGTSTAFTLGSVIFAGASGAYNQSNANFFWDNVNKRLGINTATPTTPLDVRGPTYLCANFQTSNVADGSGSIGLTTNDINAYKMELSIGGIGNGLGLNDGQLYIWNGFGVQLTLTRAGVMTIPGIFNSAGNVVTKVNGTESANTVTTNGSAGVITTSSLTTTAGGSYAITWTNSRITSASVIQVSWLSGTNTIPDIVFKATPGSGTAQLVIYNTNAALPLNGTLQIGYQII